MNLKWILNLQKFNWITSLIIRIPICLNIWRIILNLNFIHDKIMVSNVKNVKTKPTLFLKNIFKSNLPNVQLYAIRDFNEKMVWDLVKIQQNFLFLLHWI